MRNKLSKEYIKGQGIEIGGLHCPLPVEPGVKVAYVDRMPFEQLKEENPDLDVKANNIIVDSAETLEQISYNSQDFVIANHVLEHCENPLLALKNWRRVLKHNGAVFAAIPNKIYTFDKNREVTSLQHVIDDYIGGPGRSRMAHYRDWYANSTLEERKGLELEKWAALAYATNANIHFHVWDSSSINELAAYAARNFGYTNYKIFDNGAEVIVILTT